MRSRGDGPTLIDELSSPQEVRVRVKRARLPAALNQHRFVPRLRWVKPKELWSKRARRSSSMSVDGRHETLSAPEATRPEFLLFPKGMRTVMYNEKPIKMKTNTEKTHEGTVPPRHVAQGVAEETLDEKQIEPSCPTLQ